MAQRGIGAGCLGEEGTGRERERLKKEVCFLFSSLQVPAAVLEQDLWVWDTKTYRLKGKSSNPTLL